MDESERTRLIQAADKALEDTIEVLQKVQRTVYDEQNRNPEDTQRVLYAELEQTLANVIRFKEQERNDNAQEQAEEQAQQQQSRIEQSNIDNSIRHLEEFRRDLNSHKEMMEHLIKLSSIQSEAFNQILGLIRSLDKEIKEQVRAAKTKKLAAPNQKAVTRALHDKEVNAKIEELKRKLVAEISNITHIEQSDMTKFEAELAKSFKELNLEENKFNEVIRTLLEVIAQLPNDEQGNTVKSRLQQYSRNIGQKLQALHSEETANQNKEKIFRQVHNNLLNKVNILLNKADFLKIGTGMTLDQYLSGWEQTVNECNSIISNYYENYKNRADNSQINMTLFRDSLNNAKSHMEAISEDAKNLIGFLQHYRQP